MAKSVAAIRASVTNQAPESFRDCTAQTSVQVERKVAPPTCIFPAEVKKSWSSIWPASRVCSPAGDRKPHSIATGLHFMYFSKH